MPILEDAQVQYNDIFGTIAIDWHETGGFHDFAKHCGVDIDRYFPLAFELSPAIEDCDFDRPYFAVTIYAADTNKFGDSGQKITTYLEKHEGRIPAVRFHGKLAISDLFQFAKRMRIVCRCGKWSALREIEY